MSVRRFAGLPCWTGVLAVAMFFSLAATPAAPQDSGYRVIRTIHLGGEGGWDYVTVDSQGRRVYIPRGTHIMVVDEGSGKVIADIPDLKGLHGVAVAPEFNRGFATGNQSRDEGTIYVFDLKMLKITSTVKSTGIDTDSLIYDPGSKRVFVNNGDGMNTTVVDAATAQIAGTVALDGSPEAAVSDGKGNVFVNIADKAQMLEYDAKTLAIKQRWPTAPCQRPVGLSMDTAHRRLFMACQGAATLLVVMDADNGKVVAMQPIGIGADGSAYDAATNMVFVTCRDSGDGKTGATLVFHEDSPDKYTQVAKVQTIYGARTIALDSKTHHIFSIGTEQNDPVPPTAQNPNPRPRPVPSTFQLLEIGK
jgi:DNA-binding beta-propeller fold protein YncE